MGIGLFITRNGVFNALKVKLKIMTYSKSMKRSHSSDAIKELNLPKKKKRKRRCDCCRASIRCLRVQVTAHLIHELRRRGQRYGLGSACIGGGQGIAVSGGIIVMTGGEMIYDWNEISAGRLRENQ